MIKIYEGWELTRIGDAAKNGKLIVGLPGMGNVGKVTVDYLIKKLKPEHMYQIFSTCFPHSAYITKEGQIRRPEINIYYHRYHDLFFLAGDLQPLGEKECYELTRMVVDKIQPSEIITLGGVGLAIAKEKPKIYAIGTDNKITEIYAKKMEAESRTYGIVGPIVGVAGTFLTEAQSRLKSIPAVCLAVETVNKECYVGFDGAYELITSLNQALKLGLNFDEIDKDMKIIKGITNTEIIEKPKAAKKGNDNSYIG
jgi:proteasome assembly chaperone (PAC2) family protein